ncbi:DUF1684 domain-containing protein [Leucobacter tardus]|uniref:DUF1684 domain-containing protein n=1 Tax=Leucobacter tardus TaxID=501483 RepID=A0A939TNT3_9MICO|nr:DUF1684 domain-containing protein [Leucobacter tardus]MBO2990554.1 DUF1684 domain-containing protein [Leucobacter tardus]
MPHTSELTFADAHNAWHASVEAQRTEPFGPLSATALHWIGAEPEEFPDVPGLWSASDDGRVTAWFVSADGVTLDGAAAQGTVSLGPLTGSDARVLEWGDRRIEVAARGGRIALRPRDPGSPVRVRYAGTGTFPADPDWVVTARYVPRTPATVEVDSAVPGRTQQQRSPGRAEFTLGETRIALTLFGDDAAPALQLIFADATGADLTFPAARFVPAVRVDAETVVIDFNRAVNPPCAYSASATCPLPPPENRIAVRIEAGELRPGLRSPSRP